MQGILYIVSVPIGNWEDITLRALKVLEEVVYILAESYKEGDKLLNHYKIPRHIRIVDEFIMTVTGKAQKFEMQKIMEADLQDDISCSAPV